MKDTNNKKLVIRAVIGALLIFLSAVLIAVGGLVNWIPGGAVKRGNSTLSYGVKNAIAIYLGGFTGDFTSAWSFIVLVFDILVVLALLFAIVKAVRAHQPKMILCQIVAALGIAFIPYVAILTYHLMKASQATVMSLWVIAISIVLLIIGLLVLITSAARISKNTAAENEEKAPAQETLSEDQIRVIVREEIEKYEEEQPAKKELSEEDVAKISQKLIDKALDKHLDAKHSGAEEKTKEEEEPEIEEEVVEVAEEEVDENDPFAKLKNKRRANFETRLRNSEFDLRHKYYDLRDHIKSYGLKNRISIPGDSFSAHRKRYVFLTINGKHIKAYFAANPDDYKDSAIPVERTTAKKYEDLPLQFKIRSDLSFRRACKLVDDMLTKEGYEREDKPIKNTQNPDEQ